MIQSILPYLSAQCPWKDRLHWLDTTQSTNTDAKLLAQNGACQGTVVLAGRQTGGRGRMGRTFLSPANSGVYMSVILRPAQKAVQLQHLTCAVAVSVRDAIISSCGISPQIKWINDLVWQGKKLGGILTELALKPDGCVDYAIVGIGLNVSSVPQDVANMAQSLSAAAGRPIDPAQVAAALIDQLWRMDLDNKAAVMERYRSGCLTLGAEVRVHRGDDTLTGKALDLTEDGSLVVLLTDGQTITVSSGEVSVRGMYGYV